MLGLVGLLEQDVEQKRSAVQADRRRRNLSFQQIVTERGPLLLEYRQAVQALMHEEQKKTAQG